MSAYDSITELDDLIAMRDTLVARRAQGILQWTFNGQTKIFTSPREMLVVIEEMTREIRRRVAETLNLKPIRAWEGFGIIRPLEPLPSTTPEDDA